MPGMESNTENVGPAANQSPGLDVILCVPAQHMDLCRHQISNVRRPEMTRLILMAAASAAFVVPAFLLGPSLGAQAPAATAFEVASVKPNKTGDGRVMLGMQPGGRFNASNVPVRLLLRQAFNVQDFQIV